MDYMNTIECIRGKVQAGEADQALADIQQARERGLCSQELLQVEELVKGIVNWNGLVDGLEHPLTMDMYEVYTTRLPTMEGLLPPPQEIMEYVDAKRVDKL
jgi:hypothetical protein